MFLIASLRTPKSNWVSILAGIGGIWSILTGISFISLIELVYWCCNTLYNHTEVASEHSDSLSYQYEVNMNNGDDTSIGLGDTGADVNKDLIIYDIESKTGIEILLFSL